jgi:hypothetical protein
MSFFMISCLCPACAGIVLAPSEAPKPGTPQMRKSPTASKPQIPGSERGWRLGFPLYVLYSVLDPIPLMEPGYVPAGEHLIGLVGRLDLCTCTVKPDELAGGGLNLGFLHRAV